VYVPVSKTALDPVLVWFLAIRYDLPIPALILDEALAILGPFSDLLRLAGAVFIKRDPNLRSTLATAVTSAYIQYLIRERGALTLILDKVRSRTGIFQPPFDDGLIEMILKSNDEQDVVFVPINITYEEVPDLALLIQQDVQSNKKNSRRTSGVPPDMGVGGGLQRSRTTSNRMSTPTKLSRPSDSRSHRVRSRSLGNGQHEEKSNSGSLQGTHNGKLLVGVGKPICVSEGYLEAKALTDAIQKEQKKAIVVSPISMVAAILLYSRVRGNCIDLNTMKGNLEYLSSFIKGQGIPMDWQGKTKIVFERVIPNKKKTPRLDFEDCETIIFYNIRLLEKNSNIVTIDERNSGFMFRISTRSESILQLAYYANQVKKTIYLK
jgi:hypothetical protein